ncbi:MAG TPA: helix-turn-helix transcriptional regulator [Dehalococcoidia bacterium]|nr:helix-turn-helix transcriptional regulator [Dehalococcoidia bacterium]
MDEMDTLINAFYRRALSGEWRSYRREALELLRQGFDADGAAWWTRSRKAEAEAGELTQVPFNFTSPLKLARLPPPETGDEAVTEMGGAAVALVYAPARSGLLHTLALEFPQPPTAQTRARFARVGAHLCEASALCLHQFIQRDDWLHAMGRANRGAAALVDAEGTLYATSDRFRALLDELAAGTETWRLPFPLPRHALGERGGEFSAGELHLRVEPCGSWYLVYARKPLPLDQLSPREQEIARALSHGKTLKSIARQYGIAVSTVANHTTRIYRKLAIYRREDLIGLLRGGTGGH